MKTVIRLILAAGLLLAIACGAQTNSIVAIPVTIPLPTQSWVTSHWPAISVGSAWLMRELPTFMDWARRITAEGGLIPIVKAFLFGKPQPPKQ